MGAAQQSTRRPLAVAADRPELLGHLKFSVGSAFLLGVAYVVLDWVSYIEPFTELGLTVWNPTAAIALAMGLAWGLRAIPPIWLSVFAAGIVVREFPPFSPVAVISPTVIAIGYTAIGIGIRKFGLPRDFLVEPASTAASFAGIFAGSGIVSIVLVLSSLAIGELDPSQIGWATLGYWVGDATGIVVGLPAFCIFRSARQIRDAVNEFRSGDGSIFAVLSIIALTLMFAGSAEHTLQFSYLSLLPVVWIAIRRELPAVIAAITVLQIVFIVLVFLDETPASEFSEFQLLMLVIGMAGLLIAVAATSARRKSRQLADQQMEIERLERTTALAALGTALAHELSQPISSIRTAAHVAQASLQPEMAQAPLGLSIGTIKRQIEIASERIAALRTGMQHKSYTPIPIELTAVTAKAIEVLKNENASFVGRMELVSRREAVGIVDPDHLYQILVNLVRNALAAVRERYPDGQIRVEIEEVRDRIVVSILDNGPGIDREIASSIFEPMVSGRPDGVGLGLFVCRTLCDLNGAEIALRERQGWSTCFEVRFRNARHG